MEAELIWGKPRGMLFFKRGSKISHYKVDFQHADYVTNCSPFTAATLGTVNSKIVVICFTDKLILTSGPLGFVRWPIMN